MLTLVFMLSSLVSFGPTSAQDDISIRTVYGWIGKNVTLTCAGNVNYDDRILWFDQDNGRFLSTNGNINDNLTGDLQDRLSVECNRDDHTSYPAKCQLTIHYLKQEDSGTYLCRFDNSAAGTIDNVDTAIQLIVGDPPSDDSPTCETFEVVDQKYVPTDIYEIGDKIYTRCVVERSSIKPLLSWTRTNHTITTKLAHPLPGFRLFQEFILAKEDVGAVFTCVMSHPGLPEIRNCSITPLPVPAAPPTTTRKPITQASTGSTLLPVSQLSDFLTTTEKANVGKLITKSNILERSQSFVLPVIIAILCIILAIVVIIFGIFMIKRRKKPNVIPSKLNYDLTVERDRSITAEYAVVNAPDSIDKANKTKHAKNNPQGQTTNAEQDSPGTTNEEGACPIYAKPDKSKKSNHTTVEDSSRYESIPHHLSPDKAPENKADDGLMYADLDLTQASESNSQRIPIDLEATVYADIKGSL